MVLTDIITAIGGFLTEVPAEMWLSATALVVVGAAARFFSRVLKAGR